MKQVFNLARYGQKLLYSCPSTAITKEKTIATTLSAAYHPLGGPKVRAHAQ